MDRVLLTGVTGYIGQHCAAELLRQGYEVVGTIRSHAKADATRIAIAKVAPVDRLSFVEVDLLSKTGWAEAMKGCRFVVHVASPFVLAQPKDENEMIAPAVEGTQRVIAAAQRARVKRLVLTRRPSRSSPARTVADTAPIPGPTPTPTSATTQRARPWPSAPPGKP